MISQRRCGVSQILLGSLILFGLGVRFPAAADSSATLPNAQPTFRADTFSDFVGISASPFERWPNTTDAQLQNAQQALFELGVRHYRSGLINALTLPDAPAKISAVYDRYGMRTMTLVNGGKNASPKDIIGRLKLYEPGAVDLIEGPNEVNNKFPPQNLNIAYKGMTDEAGGAAFMKDLYAMMKADPATKNIGVVAYTAIFTDYHLARPCDAFDFSNMHSYQGYNIPSSSIQSNEMRFNNILPSGGVIKPFVPTECGYNVQADKSNGTNNTGSLRAQALNIPMLLAEYFRQGIKRAYLFSLTNADGYGLLEDDGTKRPSYFAFKNLLATVKDANWNPKTHQWLGGDFTPKTLMFGSNNAPPTVHTVTLQKKNGEYLLLIWNEVPNFDENTHKDIVNAPVPVTINLKTEVMGTATVLTQNAAGSYDTQSVAVNNGVLSLNVPASVMIVRLMPKSNHTTILPSPRALKGTATVTDIQLAWQPPSHGAVAGYFVYRNGEFITATNDTKYTDASSWILPGLGYTYAVQSYDASGNVSPQINAVVTTPDKRPDLICSDVEIPSVKAGDPVIFKATLKNIGDGPTPPDTYADLVFFVDGQYTSYGGTDGTPMAPGESRTFMGVGGANGGRWIATPGAHILRVQVDDIDRIPGERSKENNNVDRSLLVDVTTPGLLLGAGDPAMGQTDLTREGTLDWIHWGLDGKASVNRKATGGHQISDAADIGTGYRDATSGFGNSVRWSDGAPTATETDSHASLWLNGVGHGYQFTAPADTQERILKVYAGAINGPACTFTAHLSDGSAPDYVSKTFNGNLAFSWSPVPGGFTTVYTLRYRAASPNQKISVNWTLTDEPNQFLGQARFQAATLAFSNPK